ncbi:hypothetical protein [Legionella clemsonensis]|uniref:Uncharacterized protein n=1 Tax=Legionella clemsonensis TaxID=1867846 RepID=A0A222P5P1_9GAMM|nr:hypothetical protein [Legionella clemsonensis]ASQ47158.1 hypothetical protein clem_13125 [Legionella clemsonensis]
MIVTVKYFPSAWTFKSKEYSRRQIEQRIELALLCYATERQKNFPEKYPLLGELVFTVSNHEEIDGYWFFNFYEQGDLKCATISPGEPEKTLIVHERQMEDEVPETTGLSYSS